MIKKLDKNSLTAYLSEVATQLNGKYRSFDFWDEQTTAVSESIVPNMLPTCLIRKEVGSENLCGLVKQTHLRARDSNCGTHKVGILFEHDTQFWHSESRTFIDVELQYLQLFTDLPLQKDGNTVYIPRSRIKVGVEHRPGTQVAYRADHFKGPFGVKIKYNLSKVIPDGAFYSKDFKGPAMHPLPSTDNLPLRWAYQNLVLPFSKPYNSMHKLNSRATQK